MNVDQRLHHAARELRAIDVSVPPLRPSTATQHRPRMPTVVAGFVLVAMLAAASLGLVRASGQSSSEQVADVDPVGVTVSATSSPGATLADDVLDPREEIAIIERLGAASSNDRGDLRRPVRRGVI